jgi:E3 ubiquitin-protein ligase RNF38/44
MVASKSCVNTKDFKLLPKFQFRETMRSEDSNSSDNSCSICYDEYEVKDNLTSLSCSHKFHDKCISQWLQVNFN